MGRSVSVAIPTYGRNKVLVDTISALQEQDPGPREILVVDQTPVHDGPTTEILSQWHEEGAIRWLRIEQPSITRAMNIALKAAVSPLVLFFDDDIIPAPGVVGAHADSYANEKTWAVSGQVLQPEDWEKGTIRDQKPKVSGQRAEVRGRRAEVGGLRPEGRGLGSEGRGPKGRGVSLCEDLDFPFNGNSSVWVTNVMAGNLSVKRDRALAIGGFDENFIPPVAYRFETEFAKRVVSSGGTIRFEPDASIRHLRASSGGTRQRGSHLNSASPIHGAGDYYYALKCGRGVERFFYIFRRPFREVRTRFHMKKPWWIPVKFTGEIRAMLLAFRLYRQGPKMIEPENR